MSVLVSTANTHKAERVELWRSVVSASFVPLDFRARDAASFRGEIAGDMLGNVLVTRISADAHRVDRTQRHIAQSDNDGYYKLSIPLRGFVLISQDGREAPLIPGDIAVYDTTRPYSVIFEDVCKMLVLMFPHREFRVSPHAMQELTARRISGRHGIGGLVSPLLLSLAARMDEVNGLQSGRLADNVVDLVSTLYADSAHELGYRPADSMRTLLVQIKAYIDTHLDDPDLGPESVAAGCHISVGYLHKLFRGEESSVSRQIRDRRLAQCRRDLLDPHRRTESVSAIGAQWGFFDAAYFSRAFKEVYGASPREYRVSHEENQLDLSVRD
ncbi:MAG: helix-turn-helix domain-containing protein [Actinomycetota bacterium]|nr:helix-turn-helix domain-containing protein [Actinomycetota bacterium]